jgi:hypothetical protein
MQKPKEKKGHACTNQKKRYAGWSNCYNPQLHESGWIVISAHDLVSLLIVNCHCNLFGRSFYCYFHFMILWGFSYIYIYIYIYFEVNFGILNINKYL